MGRRKRRAAARARAASKLDKRTSLDSLPESLPDKLPDKIPGPPPEQRSEESQRSAQERQDEPAEPPEPQPQPVVLTEPPQAAAEAAPIESTVEAQVESEVAVASTDSESEDPHVLFDAIDESIFQTDSASKLESNFELDFAQDFSAAFEAPVEAPDPGLFDWTPEPEPSVFDAPTTVLFDEEPPQDDPEQEPAEAQEERAPKQPPPESPVLPEPSEAHRPPKAERPEPESVTQVESITAPPVDDLQLDAVSPTAETPSPDPSSLGLPIASPEEAPQPGLPEPGSQQRPEPPDPPGPVGPSQPLGATEPPAPMEPPDSTDATELTEPPGASALPERAQPPETLAPQPEPAEHAEPDKAALRSETLDPAPPEPPPEPWGRAWIHEASPRALEQLQLDSAAILIREGTRQPQGVAGLIDWRMAGRLGHQILKGRFSGAAGELMLMPSQGRLGLARLFLVGLGAGTEPSVLADQLRKLVVAGAVNLGIVLSPGGDGIDSISGLLHLIAQEKLRFESLVFIGGTMDDEVERASRLAGLDWGRA